MGKLKKNPEIEKIVGKDDDLRTPAHDAIIVWLNKAIDIYLPKWISCKRCWEEREFGYERGFDKKTLHRDSLPVKPNIKLVSKKIEYPITRGASDILVAVIDVRVQCQKPMLYFRVNGDVVIDFIDFYAWFEVKSKILSMGEILKQISIYKKYAYLEDRNAKSKWFLVAPNSNEQFIKIFKEQGIYFIEYLPDSIIQDEYEIDGKCYKEPYPGLEFYVGIDNEF